MEREDDSVYIMPGEQSAVAAGQRSGRLLVVLYDI